MKRTVSLLVATLALAAMTGIASAGDRSGRWNDEVRDGSKGRHHNRGEMRRDHRQDRRTMQREHRQDRKEMRRDHRQNRKEFRSSRGGRARHPEIKRLVRIAMADGRITPAERLMIRRAAQRLGR